MTLHNMLLAAETSSQDVAFIVIIGLLVAGGVALVLWSRKRGGAAGVPSDPDESPEIGASSQAVEAVPEEVPEVKEGLLPLGRTIQDGLEKTRSQGFVSRLAGLFKKELDETTELQLEEVLLTSDIGVTTAQKLLATLKEELSRTELKDSAAVWAALRAEVQRVLEKSPSHPIVEPEEGPLVIAIVGVNGTGKTTTVGKLAARYVRAGRKVLVVAADTFRAAAEDQLAIWAGRSGASFHRGKDKQDPASVAFDGIRAGVEAGAEVILVDTAGRLHTQRNLVEELKKIIKVCGKAQVGAPHETLLVLDATTGQNAIQQADIFRGEVGVQGIVLTKLDGTAKGGVVIGICDRMQIPVRYVGVGEQVEDLQPFSAKAFVEGLFGS